jgi:hypothetical protein
MPLRPHLRPDGIPTRIDVRYHSAAEVAITDAMKKVEDMGADSALTDAVMLLLKAKDRVADYVESGNCPDA